MTAVNTCLKRTFTVFNIILALVGALIISLAIMTQVVTRDSGSWSVEGRYYSLIVMYVVGSATLGIALLGVYGSHKENYAVMVVYLVLMVCGTLAVLRIGIPAVVFRPNLEGMLAQYFRGMTPLDKASGEVQDMMNNVQSAMHCCGLFRADDWNEEIPDSCLCEPEGEDECRVVDYLYYLRQKKISIYSQTCLPLIMHYIMLGADVLLGVICCMFAVVLLGLIFSGVVVHQMRFSRSTTARVALPTIFSAMPPKYEELHNPSSY